MASKGALRVVCIVGARPNFMKIAPLMRVFRADSANFDAYLVHTGQHYDEAMKDAFFRQLNIPEPDIDLGVGSGTHAVQTAEIMRRFEPVLDDLAPDLVLVVGDVNSTIACALVATKKDISVVHVEAGLRSGDRRMPEEVNRVLTDQISDLLFTTEPDGESNLLREGVDRSRVHFVGNVMIDTLLANRVRAIPAAQTLTDIEGFSADTSDFGLLTCIAHPMSTTPRCCADSWKHLWRSVSVFRWCFQFTPERVQGSKMPVWTRCWHEVALV